MVQLRQYNLKPDLHVMYSIPR